MILLLNLANDSESSTPPSSLSSQTSLLRPKANLAEKDDISRGILDLGEQVSDLKQPDTVFRSTESHQIEDLPFNWTFVDANPDC